MLVLLWELGRSGVAPSYTTVHYRLYIVCWIDITKRQDAELIIGLLNIVTHIIITVIT